MPTSPATDLLSPAAPQDTSLFSSPRPSGTCSGFVLLDLKEGLASHSSDVHRAEWSGHQLPSCVRDPQLPGGRHSSQRSAWHASQAAPGSGISQKGPPSGSPLWPGQRTSAGSSNVGLSGKEQKLTWLSSSSRAPITQSPASRVPGRIWSFGGQTSMLGRAKRSSRYGLCHQMSCVHPAFTPVKGNISVVFRGFCRGLSIRLPPRTRMPVWTSTSRCTCRSWKRCSRRRHSFLLLSHSFCDASLVFYSFICDQSCCLFPPLSDQCGRGSGPECELSPRPVLRCRTVPAAHLLPTGRVSNTIKHHLSFVWIHSSLRMAGICPFSDVHIYSSNVQCPQKSLQKTSTHRRSLD